MSKTEAFRKLALTISIAALIWMAFIGLYAPALLMVGMVWLIALVILSLIERRLDQMSLAISVGSLGIVFFVCFVPLWVGEYTAKTPDDFVELAEGFRRRGQIFGNQAKTQAYYLKAAESGNTKAQARLGEAFYFGHYGRTNREEGIRWLKVAASTGDQHALHVLRSIESN
ncbi:MAG: TPR repeat [Verrucomicrobia bacterium]|nr:MAG: TPR repeat [Verrucomicrobiota bacterium]